MVKGFSPRGKIGESGKRGSRKDAKSGKMEAARPSVAGAARMPAKIREGLSGEARAAVSRRPATLPAGLVHGWAYEATKRSAGRLPVSAEFRAVQVVKIVLAGRNTGDIEPPRQAVFGEGVSRRRSQRRRADIHGIRASVHE